MLEGVLVEEEGGWRSGGFEGRCGGEVVRLRLERWWWWWVDGSDVGREGGSGGGGWVIEGHEGIHHLNGIV